MRRVAVAVMAKHRSPRRGAYGVGSVLSTMLRHGAYAFVVEWPERAWYHWIRDEVRCVLRDCERRM